MPSRRKIKDHDDCLKLVCFFGPHKATNKTFHRIITPNVKEFILKHVYEKYEEFESVFPSGLCDSCNHYVSDMMKNGELSNKPLPDPYEDYDELLKEMQNIPRSTRSKKSACKCRICKIAKENPFFPKKSIKKSKESKKCPHCRAILGSGKQHNCGRKERIKNLMEDVTPKTRMQLALETIKEAQSKKESDSPLRVARLGGGPSVSIVVGKDANLPSTS